MCKTCTICKVTKNVMFFYRVKGRQVVLSPNDVNSYCKDCVKERKKQKYRSCPKVRRQAKKYYLVNKDRKYMYDKYYRTVNPDYIKKYCEKNRLRIAEHAKNQYLRKRKEYLMYAQMYRLANNEAIKKREALYRDKNRDIINQRKREQKRQRKMNGSLND